MRKTPLFTLVMVLLLALAAFQLLLPQRTMSEMENRKLAPPPTFSFAAFCDGTFAEALEIFAADQLPLRDQFVSAYAGMQGLLGRRLINDAIVGAEHRMFDASADWSERNVRLNTAALSELAGLTGRVVTLMAVPSAAAVYPEQLPAHVPVADEAALLSAAEENIPVLPLLSALEAQREGESLYFTTDHHWTAVGARAGYLTLCEAWGLIPAEQAQPVTCPDFFGSFYARYPLPWQTGDVFAYFPHEGVRLLVNGEEKPALVDAKALAGRDKYAALLYGNHARIELLNDQVRGGTLIVLKDSYANMLLPMLTAHFHRIVAIDPRYFAGNIVDEINQLEEGMVLCVYGMNTLASGRTLALLDGL